MRIRQLEYFLAIHRTASFTLAAKELFVAQPSLSQQIRLLERELGCELFDRQPSGVHLTEAGTLFLRHAAGMIRAVKDAEREMAAYRDGYSGEIEILTVRSVATGVLPASIVQWHLKYPDVIVRMRDFFHRTKLEAALADGIGDVAVGPRPEFSDGTTISLGYEELLVVGPEKLTQPAALVPSELVDKDWVLFEGEHGLAEVIEALDRRYGLNPRGATRTWQVEAAMDLAIKGLGVALIPENVVPRQQRNHAARLGDGVFRELVVYSRARESPLASRYIELLTATHLPLVDLDQVPKGAFIL